MEQQMVQEERKSTAKKGQWKDKEEDGTRTASSGDPPPWARVMPLQAVCGVLPIGRSPWLTPQKQKEGTRRPCARLRSGGREMRITRLGLGVSR